VKIKARETGVNGPALLGLMLIPALTLSGCGGAKVLKTPEPYVATQVLVTASDQQVTADLDWVIYRDGPGRWAKTSIGTSTLLRSGTGEVIHCR